MSEAEDEPRVEVRRSARRKRTVTAYREGDTIVVLLPGRMSAREERDWVRQMVDRVLAREARASGPRGDDDLARRAAELAEEHLAPALGFVPAAASVSWVANQRHRWGSCTPSTRTIRLSERLRPLPSWVVDYVLLHELTHLVEPSHSARFWALVGRYPRAERARGYLEGFQTAGGSPTGRGGRGGGGTGEDGPDDTDVDDLDDVEVD